MTIDRDFDWQDDGRDEDNNEDRGYDEQEVG